MGEDARRSVAAAEALEVFGGSNALASQAAQSMEKESERKDPHWKAWEGRDKTKYQRKGEYAGKGGRTSWHRQLKRKEPTEEEIAASTSLDQATQHLIQSMTRLVLRHEGELSHLRREMGRLYDVRRRSGLLVSGCPEAGSSEVARALCANKVTSSLGLSLLMGLVQTLRAKLEELLRDDACSRPTRAVAGSEMASTPSHRCSTISSGARQGRRSFSLRRHHFHMPESWRSYGFC